MLIDLLYQQYGDHPMSSASGSTWNGTARICEIGKPVTDAEANAWPARTESDDAGDLPSASTG